MNRQQAHAFVKKPASPATPQNRDAYSVLVNLPPPMSGKTTTRLKAQVANSAARMTLQRRLTAEVLGTAFLLAIVIGVNTMSARLMSGNPGLAQLVNILVIGAGLIALILAFGAHIGRTLQSHRHPVSRMARQYPLA